MVAYRSVSQVLQLDDCGYAYYLDRIWRDENGNRAWRRPAAWFPQGLAVHEAAEAIERSGRTMTLAEAQDVYTASYDAHTDRLTGGDADQLDWQATPNLNHWFRSGPYAGPADVERRYHLGLAQVERYIEFYYEKNPDDVPFVTPGGVLAVELPFEVDFGGVEVRGVIDYITKDGKPRDNKSGNKPGKPFQLGVYAGVIEKLFGIKPTTGDFWMGKTGKATVPIDLTEWTPERLAEEFRRADEQIRAEMFEPDPEPSKCMFCSVSSSCEFRA